MRSHSRRQSVLKVDGSPDVAPFWYATIFTDALAGLAIVAFTAVSARASAAGRAPRAADG